MANQDIALSGTGRKTGLMAAVAAGILARIILSAVSIGSNDATTWYGFASAIDKGGLRNLYRTDPLFNHPPLMGMLAWVALKVGEWLPPGFFFWFRLPGIICEIFTTCLIVRYWRKHGTSEHALLMGCIFSLSPVAILLSGFHGNTDSIYSFLVVASVYLMSGRLNKFWPGFLWAAAVNVKIIPLILIPLVLCRLENARDRLLWVLGLAAGALPILVFLLDETTPFFRNVFGYNSQLSYWGIQGTFLLIAGNIPPLETVLTELIAIYDRGAKFFIVGAVLMLTARDISLRLGSPFVLIAAGYSIFLVLAPGFGGQYFALIAALSCFTTPFWASRINLFAGVYIAINYAYFMHTWLPLQSIHGRAAPPAVVFFSYPIWLLLIAYIFMVLFRPSEMTNNSEGLSL